MWCKENDENSGSERHWCMEQKRNQIQSVLEPNQRFRTRNGTDSLYFGTYSSF